MTTSQDRADLSALIDGHLDARREAALRQRLEQDPELRAEYDQLLRLRQGLRREMAPPAVTAEEWDSISLRALSRQGQRLGWLLFTPAVLALLVGGSVLFFGDPNVPLWTRIAFGALSGGLTFLLLAAIADRLRARRMERYDEVQR